MNDASLIDSYPFAIGDFDPEVDTITSELVAPKPSAADRSIARRASLQILYELDTTDHPMAAAIEAHLAERPESYAVRQQIRRYVEGVIAKRVTIDSILQEFAPEWPVDQVAVIDRNILRIAIYEFLLQKRQTPVPVIVNEAVHLAQIFGAENAHSFVHGVIGAITSELEPLLHRRPEEAESL